MTAAATGLSTAATAGTATPPPMPVAPPPERHCRRPAAGAESPESPPPTCPRAPPFRCQHRVSGHESDHRRQQLRGHGQTQDRPRDQVSLLCRHPSQLQTGESEGSYTQTEEAQGQRCADGANNDASRPPTAHLVSRVLIGSTGSSGIGAGGTWSPHVSAVPVATACQPPSNRTLELPCDGTVTDEWVH